MQQCSVTQALSPFTDFSQVPPDRLEYATDRGSRVHHFCAARAKRLHISYIPEDCKGYFNSFLYWLNVMVKEVLFVEKEFIDKTYGYVGHPDLGVILKDGTYALLDLKTPLALQPTWKGQIAAYLNVVRKTFRIDKGGSLRLDPKGKPPKMIWYEDETADFAAFLSALTAYKYFNGG